MPARHCSTTRGKTNKGRKTAEYAASRNKPRGRSSSGTDTGKNGYLSNWAVSSFQLDGWTFTSDEQYIMKSKAVLMGDEARATLIMSTNDPRAQRKLGRQVHLWKPKVRARHMESVQLQAERVRADVKPLVWMVDSFRT